MDSNTCGKGLSSQVLFEEDVYDYDEKKTKKEKTNFDRIFYISIKQCCSLFQFFCLSLFVATDVLFLW